MIVAWVAKEIHTAFISKLGSLLNDLPLSSRLLYRLNDRRANDRHSSHLLQ
jgi:hypothetical protein